MTMLTNSRQQLELLATALQSQAKRSSSRLLTWSIVNRANLKPGLPFNLSNLAYLAGIYR
jgi:hypothetical protein